MNHVTLFCELDKLNEARNCLESGWRLLFNPLRDAMYSICDILQDVEGEMQHTVVAGSLIAGYLIIFTFDGSVGPDSAIIFS